MKYLSIAASRVPRRDCSIYTALQTCYFYIECVYLTLTFSELSDWLMRLSIVILILLELSLLRISLKLQSCQVAKLQTVKLNLICPRPDTLQSGPWGKSRTIFEVTSKFSQFLTCPIMWITEWTEQMC